MFVESMMSKNIKRLDNIFARLSDHSVKTAVGN